MGKFKFSKRAYLKKVKDQQDWKGGEGRKEEKRKLVNKELHCHKYVDMDGRRATKVVEIKDSVCSSAGTCHADCSYR